jgi:SSS family solute:Na+ symporter
MAVGVVYLLIDIPIITDEQLIAGRLGLPFMLVGGIFFALCLVIYIVVSLATPVPDEVNLKNLVWDSPLAFLKEGKIQGITDPRIMALMLLILMIVLYRVM